MLAKYGTSECGDAGQFTCPYLCAGDDDGDVMIADNGNDRLLVMSELGEIDKLQLQPLVSRPCGALLYKNCVYVTSMQNDSTFKIYKYEPNDASSTI